MVDQSLLDDLRLAHVMADNADSLTMSRFKALDLQVTAKPDLTPVSDADVAVEDAIRRTLKTARPRDAVHGEEREDTGWGPRRWVIDPIDGTKNFVRGVPVWATLIALLEDGVPVVGVVSAPALGRRWWAGTGAAVTYQHGLDEVRALVSSGAASAAVLIRPTSLEEIRRTAREGLLMPPKSTFFTPKLLTGLLVREIA